MVTTNIPKLTAATVLAAVLLVLGPASALADEAAHDGSVLIHANADVTVPTGSHRDAIVVFAGNAVIHGQARTVVVINGTATVAGGAHVGSLVVVSGRIDLEPASTVDHVWAARTDYRAASDAVVGAYETVDPSWLAAALTGAGLGVALVLLLGLVIVGRTAGNRRKPESGLEPGGGAEGDLGRPMFPPTWR
jgi:hypothetical protein